MNPFYRVDNRLVHGQIISTWMPHLRLRRIVIANDTIPDSTMQMTMYRMAIPEGVAFDALPVQQAAAWLNARRYGNDPTMVLLETVDDAIRLFASGHPFPTLNIGNVHHAPGRRVVTNAVYLGDDDLHQLRKLADRGVAIEVRSLPDETPTDLRAALRSA